MSITINVNGQSINYPETGDTNWEDEATDFAVQTSAAFGKLGLASGTSVDIAQTLDVTGNTTLDANLSVAGTTSLTGNVTLANNLTVNGNTTLGNTSGDTTTVTGIVNVDSGVLYVDPVNNRVGINDTTPSEALDVTGNALISGTLGVTGNSTLTGNLSVNGNTTLGDASGDSLTINSNGVSIPNGLNINTNTLVIDATNNRVGVGIASPANRLNIGGETAQFPTSLAINETGHASSKRAGILIGSWLQMQDSQGNGTRDLSFYYTQGTPYTAFNIGTNGQLNAVVPSGSTLYPGYLCRAWVNFNGTTASPSTIRGSGNVSSITKNATGDYTINFITAMPDVNYSVNITVGDTSSPNPNRNGSIKSALSVGSFTIITGVPSTGSTADMQYVCVSVFR